MAKYTDYNLKPPQAIAEAMNDPKQWLYVMLEQIIKNNPNSLPPEKISELKANLERIDSAKSPEIPLHELYDLVLPLLTEEQKKELYKIFEQEINNLRLARTEKNEIYLYARVAGPILSAYLRGCKCTFTNTSNNSSTYNGADEQEMQKCYRVAYNYCNGYDSEPDNINNAIRRIDRIIHNSPPLQEDTILFRGVNSIYFNGTEIAPTCGALINDKSFISTSLLHDAAYHQNSYMMIIQAPAGTKGVYMGTYGPKGVYSDKSNNNYSCQEYLLARGTTLKITFIGIDSETLKPYIECEVISQKQHLPDNVVDLYKLRSIPIDFDYDTYNTNFNQLETGVDVKEFINTLVVSGLLDRFYDECADMQELYKKEDGPDVIDHGCGHVQRVLLYTMYLGRKLNLSDIDMDLLITATKYHDVGIYNGHYGHGRVSAQKLLNTLEGKLPQSALNKIAAIIECHEIDDDERMFAKIFNRYKIPRKERKKILGLISILKDADALDRTRFRNNLNTDYLRNRESLELVRTSYQIQEIRGKKDLNEKIKNGQFSEEEKQQIERYRSQEIPDYVISHSFATYSLWGFSTAGNMVNAWMNTPSSLVR